MGSFQKYFAFEMMLAGVIPSVTLLGEREDCLKPEGRLGKAVKSREECAKFAELLKPVLDHFVTIFKQPESEATVDFCKRPLIGFGKVAIPIASRAALLPSTSGMTMALACRTER